jgi:hypothetical protein
MKRSILFGLAALVLLFSSCTKDVIRGGGSISTRIMNLPAFSAIESHYDISAQIVYGTVQEVSVTGYDNLLNILEFKVENGVLKMMYDKDYESIRNGNIVATIKIPMISKATIHGSQNVSISNFTGNTLNAKIHGSGKIEINNSTYQSAFLDIYGSGDIDAQTLQTKQAETNIHGSGDISVAVSDHMKANIYGSGNVYYWGNPVIETEQHGSGRVIKR